ncbi:hypothetical protein HMPREF1580_00933 [Gardnerella vaginalis JCP8070]|nr:hypothetical protein HMPREF1580_00933 [Gardnerella vaginalis JCP8070]
MRFESFGSLIKNRVNKKPTVINPWAFSYKFIRKSNVLSICIKHLAFCRDLLPFCGEPCACVHAYP